jgi:hypothetical protein
MKKITEESKWCFSHGFTVPEKTKNKPLPLAVLTIAVAPLRETVDLYSPLPDHEDWDEHPEMGNIEEEMCYFIFIPTRAWEERMTLH